MRNPRTAAILCAIGGALAAWSVFFHGPESPSPMVMIMQWLLLIGCAIGVIVSLIQMAGAND